MDQHTYVKYCQDYYKEEGLTPGNPDDGEWQDAHYPAPKGVGGNTILLLFDHHQVQGLLQSEEYKQCCFFAGHAKEFLVNGPFIEGWFELWVMYEKWHSSLSSQAGKKGGATTGKKAQQDEIGFFARTPEKHSKDSQKAGRKAVETGQILTLATPESCAKGGSVAGKLNNHHINKVLWRCTVCGEVSTAAGLTHIQRARNIDKANRERVYLDEDEV